MSSRKLFTLLDGLPPDSWYKLSFQRYIEEVLDKEEHRLRADVKSLIYAQLTGQEMEIDASA